MTVHQASETTGIAALFVIDGTAEVIAYHPGSDAVMRVSPVVIFLTTPEGKGYTASLDHDRVSEVPAVASSAVELAIPSVAFAEIPDDPRFQAIDSDIGGDAIRYEAAIPIGLRDPIYAGRVLPVNRVTYDLDPTNGRMLRTTYAADDPAKAINTYDIQSERHLETWFVAPSHGTARLERVWEVDESFFSIEGLKDSVAMVREHRWNERQEALAEGRFQNRDGNGLSTSAKIGIVSGLIVLIAVAAMIRQRMRS